MLSRQELHVRLQQAEGVVRRANLRLLLRAERHQAPAQFQGGLDLDALHPADARHLAQFLQGGAVHPGQAARLHQQALRDSEHGLARPPHAQNNRQQLRGGETTRAERLQLLPRLLGGRPVLDGKIGGSVVNGITRQGDITHDAARRHRVSLPQLGPLRRPTSANSGDGSSHRRGAIRAG